MLAILPTFSQPSRAKANVGPMMNVYWVLISHIRYCINNWCFENSILIRKLQSICNRFLKMTFNLEHNSDVTEAMKDAQLFTVNNLYNLEIVQMMFKYKNKQLLQAFNNFLHKNL